ncbi:hypothetical protein CC78DRAFT_46827 [Lojkania enalia]|uniref:Uncharacterized protein n=1 Tax=Lojkania enalia TaxID=147567 RepID=A0A9P4KFJ4_9PLEO|nr:hypothetical protein CC78DRAFT_46827 [Didymosphaeria enalia]
MQAVAAGAVSMIADIAGRCGWGCLVPCSVGRWAVEGRPDVNVGRQPCCLLLGELAPRLTTITVTSATTFHHHATLPPRKYILHTYKKYEKKLKNFPFLPIPPLLASGVAPTRPKQKSDPILHSAYMSRTPCTTAPATPTSNKSPPNPAPRNHGTSAVLHSTPRGRRSSQMQARCIHSALLTH